LALWSIVASQVARGITIETVGVGHRGNAPDSTGYGAVSYDYQIAKHEVTNSQYVAFLNAVDPNGDNQHGLFDSGGPTGTKGIQNSPIAPAGSHYSVVSGRGNNPVNHVSIFDAVRFANWLQNGQGGPGTTEYGSYTITGGNIAAETAFVRNGGSGPRWVVPSENEWYKAAYHQPSGLGGDSDNYWLYPTKSNTQPYSDQPPGSGAPTPSNTANFFRNDGTANGYNDGYAVTGLTSFNSSTNYLSNVGGYTTSASHYGTFDQGGNLFEWTDSSYDAGITWATRGGSFHGLGGGSATSDLNYNVWGDGDEFDDIGFRVALVPEPGSYVLAIAALMALAAISRGRLRRI
jgi:formylglycine-generating enzyme required for sulfatase activity